MSSFGFAVTNNNESIVLDGESPLYFIPPFRKTKSWANWAYYGTSSVSRPNIGGSYLLSRARIGRQCVLQFETPLRSLLPPTIFMLPDYNPSPPDGPHGVGGYFQENLLVIDPGGEQGPTGGQVAFDQLPSLHCSWVSTIRYYPEGSAYAWTGVKVVYDTAFFTNTQKNHTTEIAAAAAYVPDYTDLFIPVGLGASPTLGGYGAVVKDEDERVVFNSNSNFLVGEGVASNWNYLGRSGGSGTYHERWGTVLPRPSGAYVRVIPQLRYRRYNGELARVAIVGYRNPRRMIIGGRSGSPAHTPIIYGRPFRTPETW